MNKTEKDLIEFYQKADPWGYQTNPADIYRKEVILNQIAHTGCQLSALDIACGEGWITQDIEVSHIYGLELVANARARWAPNIRPWKGEEVELVLITGALYENYWWEDMIEIANRAARDFIITCNIEEREYRPAIEAIQGKQTYQIVFPYDRSPNEKFRQILRIFQV